MSEAKVKPHKDPFFMDESEMIFGGQRSKFCSQIFVLSKHDEEGHAEYEALMNSIYPFDQDSNRIFNPYGKIIRNVDRDGNIVIHVEYLELEEDEPDFIKAARAKAEEEDRGDDEEYIEKLAGQLSGNKNFINW
jgi:hypothetical protein